MTNHYYLCSTCTIETDKYLQGTCYFVAVLLWEVSVSPDQRHASVFINPWLREIGCQSASTDS